MTIQNLASKRARKTVILETILKNVSEEDDEVNTSVLTMFIMIESNTERRWSPVLSHSEPLGYRPLKLYEVAAPSTCSLDRIESTYHPWKPIRCDQNPLASRSERSATPGSIVKSVFHIIGITIKPQPSFVAPWPSPPERTSSLRSTEKIDVVEKGLTPISMPTGGKRADYQLLLWLKRGRG